MILNDFKLNTVLYQISFVKRTEFVDISIGMQFYKLIMPKYFKLANKISISTFNSVLAPMHSRAFYK